MKIPYIRIKQRGEVFFCSKMKVADLRSRITFHFRDPYSKDNPLRVEESNQYFENIRRKGIELTSSPEGIQRRLQIDRINDIRNFVQSSETSFFANSILLSADVSEVENFEEEYQKYEAQETGYFVLPDDVKFMVIDGQHRLGGLISCRPEIVDEFELAIVLLFNVSRATAAKLFSDINGKQKPVSRSLIYDLFGEMDKADIGELKKLHEICQQFYNDTGSPLYRQIKMLGTGNGAISQAFFIDYVREALKKAGMLHWDAQASYNELFYYFKSFQAVFPEDWPVPAKYTENKDVESHAENVLKVRRSQLVKTNGFGAIMKIFPLVLLAAGGEYSKYLHVISKLQGQISWVPGKGQVQGTGKGFQTQLYRQMEKVLFGGDQNPKA
jgi:DGQHR domain-containing protein